MKSVMWATSFLCAFLQANELIITTSTGAEYHFNVSQDDSFLDTLSTLQSLENSSGNLHISLNLTDSQIVAKTKPGKPSNSRDYYKPLSAKDQENITYLLTTLGYQSILKINSKKSNLNKVGEQIEHIHPLLFLKYVFTNDELIAAIHNIRDRAWIWKDFISRILESLSTESSIGNISSDQIHNLAAETKLDPSLIEIPIQAHDWNNLIENLLENVKRSGNPKRYDM